LEQKRLSGCGSIGLAHVSHALVSRRSGIGENSHSNGGGTDAVREPFAYPELRARIRALLHRTYERPAPNRIRVGALAIDRASRHVHVADTAVDVSKMEFALLSHLAGEPTRVWTKEELLREVWGFRSMGRTRTLDSHACRLRNKLADAGGRYIENVWGVGYRLVA
jgi:DNA-binding response OmpR family regulator